MNYTPSQKVKAKAILELRKRQAENSRNVTFADLRIMSKKRRIERLTLNAVQANLIHNLTGRDLVLKSRQVGVSTAIQAWLFAEALNTTARIGVIAHDDDTTQKMRDMQQLFYDELDSKIKPERARNSATRAYYPRTKSQVYIATAGNRTAGRGGTYSHIHGSEVAFWSNAAQIVAGMMQGVPPDGHVVFESTANGAQGWFYLEVMAALRGDSEFTVHFYPWWKDEDCVLPIGKHEHLAYTADEQALVNQHGLTAGQIKFRRKKQTELRELFAQEYPESIESAFLTSGDNVFGDVKRYLYEQTNFKPIPGHIYIGAMDWGQANDYTTLSIMDVTDYCEVYINRWRRQDYAVMRHEALDACEHWGVSLLAVEQNSASSNIEDLNTEVEERGLDAKVYAFVMTQKLKADMVSVFKTALQDDHYKILDPRDSMGIAYATAELQQWQTKQSSNGLWGYTHPDGGHDDTIIARIAAVYHAAIDLSMSIEPASDDFMNMWLGKNA